MTGPRLLVVDPRLEDTGPEGVDRVVGRWGGPWQVLRPARVPGDGPRVGDGTDADAVVVLGSAASVHDRLPWLERLADWLEPLLSGARPRPLLGLCFGHQLLAHLAGGEVGLLHADGRKEVGVSTTVVEGSRLLPGRRELRVVVSHCELVRRPPPGWRVVAHRDLVAVDGLEHPTLPVFGFQFHPEARQELALRRGLDPALVDARVHADGDAVLDAFARFAWAWATGAGERASG